MYNIYTSWHYILYNVYYYIHNTCIRFGAVRWRVWVRLRDEALKKGTRCGSASRGPSKGGNIIVIIVVCRVVTTRMYYIASSDGGEPAVCIILYRYLNVYRASVVKTSARRERSPRPIDDFYYYYYY